MRRGFVVLVTWVAVFLAGITWWTRQIAGGDSVALANSVGESLRKEYGPFQDQATVERGHTGQTFYVRPGVGGHPTVIVYEVTSPDDMAKVEEAARHAVAVTGARSATLRFLERQIVKDNLRGAERLVKETTITATR